MGLTAGVGEPTPIYSVALALDKDDNPHIAYTLVAKKQVKYAVKRDGKWQTTVISGVRDVPYPDRHGITLDANGNPYISFYDPGTGALQIAFKKGDRWIVEVLEDSAGFSSSIQADGDSIWVAYPDESTGSVKVARRVIAAAAPVVAGSPSPAKPAGK